MELISFPVTQKKIRNKNEGEEKKSVDFIKFVYNAFHFRVSQPLHLVDLSKVPHTITTEHLLLNIILFMYKIKNNYNNKFIKWSVNKKDRNY